MKKRSLTKNEKKVLIGGMIMIDAAIIVLCGVAFYKHGFKDGHNAGFKIGHKQGLNNLANSIYDRGSAGYIMSNSDMERVKFVATKIGDVA